MGMKVAWSKSVSSEFVTRVRKIAEKFGWGYVQVNYLMSCMAFETGQTFSPMVMNAAGSNAIGLIQFMPATAKGLGTTTEKLAKMSAIEQLAYVEKYFKPYYKKINTLSDMYMAILMPKYITHRDDAILFSGGIAYRQNSGLDANHDGKITKSEATAKVYAMLERGLKPENCYETN